MSGCTHPKSDKNGKKGEGHGNSDKAPLRWGKEGGFCTADGISNQNNWLHSSGK